MKDKKINLIFVVFAFCLILNQTGFGDDLKSKYLPGDEAKMLKDGKQTIFITLGEPDVAMMKDNSNPNKNNIWFVVLSKETNQDETEGLSSEDTEVLLPTDFDLKQNFPNPFNPSTTINFQIPGNIGSEKIHTVINVFDVLGRLVRTVVDENLPAGFHTRHWDGLNDYGEKITSGVYFYSIKAGDFRKTKGMLLLK